MKLIKLIENMVWFGLVYCYTKDIIIFDKTKCFFEIFTDKDLE